MHLPSRLPVALAAVLLSACGGSAANDQAQRERDFESMLTNALVKQRQLYHSEPRAAMQVVGAGESGPKQVAPPAETAAWTLLVNLVLNLDETLTRT